MSELTVVVGLLLTIGVAALAIKQEQIRREDVRQLAQCREIERALGDLEKLLDEIPYDDPQRMWMTIDLLCHPHSKRSID